MTTKILSQRSKLTGKLSKMATTGMQMDPLFLAMSFYRRRKFEECAEVCTQLLKKNPYDKVLNFRGNQ